MAGSRNVTKYLVSIIFIAYGISSVFDVFEALLTLDLGAVLGCALGVLMFVTGVFGFLKNQITVCRVLGVIICILSVLSFALSLAGGQFAVQMLVQALLAWIYFDCM